MAAGRRAGKPHRPQNCIQVSTETQKTAPSQRYPCHCCRKPASVYWSEKRRCFICENCLKTFDLAVIAKRNGLAAEQLSLV